MNSDSRKELWVGIFFLTLSAAYMMGTININTFTPFGNRGLDSRSVPQLIGFLAFILAVVHLAQLFFRVKKMKKNDSGQNDSRIEEVCDPDEVACIVPPGGDFISRVETFISVKLLLSSLLLVIYFASYQALGFILSSIFFLIAEIFLLTKKEKRRSWGLFIVAFSISASVIIYILFTKYLSLFLPVGILG